MFLLIHLRQTLHDLEPCTLYILIKINLHLLKGSKTAHSSRPRGSGIKQTDRMSDANFPKIRFFNKFSTALPSLAVV